MTGVLLATNDWGTRLPGEEQGLFHRTADLSDDELAAIAARAKLTVV
jgi:hypothetical protein